MRRETLPRRFGLCDGRNDDSEFDSLLGMFAAAEIDQPIKVLFDQNGNDAGVSVKCLRSKGLPVKETI